MKLILKVTGVTKVTDDKQLVQLQGKFGNVSLNLPLTARVTIGDEFVLGRHQETALGHVGDIDETRGPFDPTLPSPANTVVSTSLSIEERLKPHEPKTRDWFPSE
jgi:hypothetical protein